MARATTVRVNISDIVQARFDSQGPHFVSPLGIEMRRVMVVGHVVRSIQSKKEREYASIILDDGTDTVQVKAWDSDLKKLNLVRNVEEGVLVLVIGKIKQSGQQDIYIEPEIIRRLTDPNYITLHILERLRGLIVLSDVPSRGRSLSDIESVESLTTGDAPIVLSATKTSTKTRTSEPISPSVSSNVSEGSNKTRESQVFEFIRQQAARKGDGRGVDGKDIIEFFVAKGFTKTEVNLYIIDLLDAQKIREVSVSKYLPCDL